MAASCAPPAPLRPLVVVEPPAGMVVAEVVVAVEGRRGMSGTVVGMKRGEGGRGCGGRSSSLLLLRHHCMHNRELTELIPIPTPLPALAADINPFTATACTMSGQESAEMHVSKQRI